MWISSWIYYVKCTIFFNKYQNYCNVFVIVWTNARLWYCIPVLVLIIDCSIGQCELELCELWRNQELSVCPVFKNLLNATDHLVCLTKGCLHEWFDQCEIIFRTVKIVRKEEEENPWLWNGLVMYHLYIWSWLKEASLTATWQNDNVGKWWKRLATQNDL